MVDASLYSRNRHIFVVVCRVSALRCIKLLPTRRRAGQAKKKKPITVQQMQDRLGGWNGWNEEMRRRLGGWRAIHGWMMGGWEKSAADVCVMLRTQSNASFSRFLQASRAPRASHRLALATQSHSCVCMYVHFSRMMSTVHQRTEYASILILSVTI